MRELDLDAATWRELNRLLDEALELPARERRAWLDGLSSEHARLKPRLESLLSHADEPALLMSTIPKLDAETELESRQSIGEDSETPGDVGATVGPYRLKRLLGKGGMGAVWLAERVDGLLQRPVALKLPRGMWSRPELASRLAREREILASLDHPNIGRLFDAGLTEDGQPFLALELIEGRAVDEFVRERALSLEARLRLFLEFARAVAHAHARLVVHRDIKPSNILVTENEHVHLLDFGIAKILEDGQAEETEITRMSGRALTLAYAAPEQILGEPIGVGADIYSLGVVLYELLTGSRPYVLERETRGALEDAILNAEPRTPSDVAEPALRRSLRGDLDTILLKALKKAPSERYATVDAFAEDVERFLEGRPVRAQPDRRWYRFKKFVGRNRLAVGAGLAMLLSIVTGAGMALSQARIALAEKQRAEEVKEFIVSVFVDADPFAGGGEALTAADLLRQAKDRIDESFDNRPALRTELRNLLANSLLSLEDYDTAEEVLRQSIEDGASSLGATHPEVLRARILMTSVHRFLGRADEMREQLDVLLPLARTSASLPATDLVLCLRNAVHVAIDQGRTDDAVSIAEETLGIATRRLGDDHVQTLSATMLVALTTSRSGDWRRAVEASEAALRRASRIYRDKPRHPQLIDVRNTYAGALARAGRTEEALEQSRRATSDAELIFGEDSMIVGFFSQHQSDFLRTLGELDEALMRAERSAAILTKLAQPESLTYASGFRVRGLAHLWARRGALAAADLEIAVASLTHAFGPRHRSTLSNASLLVLALAYAGENDTARERLASLLSEWRLADVEPDSWTHYARGVLERADGRHEEARRAYETAMEMVDDNPSFAVTRAMMSASLGAAQLDAGETVAAKASLQNAVDELDRLQTAMTPDHADALGGLGRVALVDGDVDRAVRFFESADAFWRERDPDSPSAGEAAFWLAQGYAARAEPLRAHEHFARAIPRLRASSWPYHAALADAAQKRVADAAQKRVADAAPKRVR